MAEEVKVEEKVTPPNPPEEVLTEDKGRPKKVVKEALVKLTVVENGIVLTCQAVGDHIQEVKNLVYNDTEAAGLNAMTKLKEYIGLLPS